MTRRLAAVVLVAMLSGLTFTGCDLNPDPSTGSCAHAASTKTTAEDDFYGVTKSLAETFVWVRWIAATGCTQAPLFWTNWSWNCSSWWYVIGPPSTNTVADSCWHEVYDHWRSSGVTAVNQAEFQTGGDHYRLRSRVVAAADGWVYWYCGRTDLNGGGQVGWVACDYNLDY